MSTSTNQHLSAPYDSSAGLPAAGEWQKPITSETSPVRANDPGLSDRETRAESRRERGYEGITRFMGMVVSAAALLILAPLMIVIAILIKRDSPGHVFFRHMRIGVNRRSSRRARAGELERRKADSYGKPFTLYKFRSMYHDARERFPHLYSYSYSDEEMKTLPIKILVSTKGDPREFNNPSRIEDMQTPDPRVTPLGQWLRRTSLDELPNFINVLKGDMNLVGPRPDIVENIRFYPEEHMRKLDVKPGITGLAQVNGRGRLSFQKTNEYDVEYVKNRSLLLDLKILAKTIVVSLRRDGAF